MEMVFAKHCTVSICEHSTYCEQRLKMPQEYGIIIDPHRIHLFISQHISSESIIVALNVEHIL